MRPLVKWNLIVLALAVGLACANGAYADTLSWSLTGTGVTGSGAFTATNEGGGEYLVTAMTGTLFVNGTGGMITQLLAPNPEIPVPGGYFFSDNLVNLSASSTSPLDDAGLTFGVTNFTNLLNLCTNPGCNYNSSTGTQTWLLTNGLNGPNYVVNFSVTTPELSTLGLLGLGLLGLMLVRGRERLRVSC